MNDKFLKTFGVIIFLSISPASYGKYPGMDDLTGQYDITGKTAIDPPEDEPKDTHFRVYLTGKAAMDLYNSMKVKPMEDGCLGDGSVSKWVGDMQCTNIRNSGEYECRFSIDVGNQKIDYGWSC